MKKRNASQGKQLNRTTSNTVKAPPVKSIDKKWFIVGAAVLLAVVILTAGLIRVYGDNVVARVNGINIRGSEVSQAVIHLMQHDEDFQMWMSWGMLSQEDANTMGASRVAFNKLLEDYARRNGISFARRDDLAQRTDAIVDAIIADDGLFANFEEHMPRDLYEAEAKAGEVLTRILMGENFDNLMFAYSGDQGLHNFPDGYAFIEGAMVEEFFEAARNLEIGEISGLVLTQFGFHIIQRIEPPEDTAILTPWGEVPPPLDTEDELFGAKHILIGFEDLSHQARRRWAVFHVFEEKLGTADLVLLPGIGNVE